MFPVTLQDVERKARKKRKYNINYSGDKSTFEKYETKSPGSTSSNKIYISKSAENSEALMH